MSTTTVRSTTADGRGWRGQLRTIRSGRDGIGLSTGGLGVLGIGCVYPPDFDIVEQHFAVAIHEVSFDPHLDVFFIPVCHRDGHLGTTPRELGADRQQKVRRAFAIKHLGDAGLPWAGRRDRERGPYLVFSQQWAPFSPDVDDREAVTVV